MDEADGDKLTCIACGTEGIGIGFTHHCVSREARAIADWLRSSDAGALFGSTTKDWRSRVDSI